MKIEKKITVKITMSEATALWLSRQLQNSVTADETPHDVTMKTNLLEKLDSALYPEI